jgi:hypothetical protein
MIHVLNENCPEINPQYDSSFQSAGSFFSAFCGLSPTCEELGSRNKVALFSIWI